MRARAACASAKMRDTTKDCDAAMLMLICRRLMRVDNDAC